MFEGTTRRPSRPLLAQAGAVAMILGGVVVLFPRWVVLALTLDPPPNATTDAPLEFGWGGAALVVLGALATTWAEGVAARERPPRAEVVGGVLAVMASLVVPSALIDYVHSSLIVPAMLAAPALGLFARGRLGPRSALTWGIAFAALASMPRATTAVGTEKLSEVFFYLYVGGWLPRVAGLGVAAAFAFLAGCRARGSLRAVSFALGWWFLSEVVRNGVAAALGFVFADGTPDHELAARLAAVATAADLVLVLVVALAFVGLAAGGVRRYPVGGSAALLVAGLLAAGPQHDPFVLSQTHPEPAAAAGLGPPLELPGGWELGGAVTRRSVIDPDGSVRSFSVGELTGNTRSGATRLHAPATLTMDELRAARRELGSELVFLTGPRQGTAVAAAAASRWPGVAVAFQGGELALPVLPDGSISCPDRGYEAPRSGETVAAYLERVGCGEGRPGTWRDRLNDDRWTRARWLLVPSPVPRFAGASLVLGLLIGGALLLRWRRRELAPLRAASPSALAPPADAEVRPSWVGPAGATHRWLGVPGEGTYRENREVAFAGPASVAEAEGLFRERLVRGIGRAALYAAVAVLSLGALVLVVAVAVR
ncbi:MAG: hypothetical protein CMN30_12665 [Sandaracinus sp.]|nr:hypothetical protein [Sandaracinus sp.]